jgi:hypothetical protein
MARDDDGETEREGERGRETERPMGRGRARAIERREARVTAYAWLRRSIDRRSIGAVDSSRGD